MTTLFTRCFAIAAAAFIAVSLPGESALAQSATNLKCKGCVGKRDLGKKAITRKAVRKNAIDTKALRDSAVTSAKIAGQSVTESKLADGSVTAAKLADNVPFSGFAHGTVGGEAVPLPLGGLVVASTVLDAPTNGFVFIVATAELRFDDKNMIECSIGTDGEIGNFDDIKNTSDEDDEIVFRSLATSAATRIGPGPQTFELYCAADVPDGTALVRYPKITALFVPREY